MVTFYEVALGLEFFGDLEMPGGKMKRFTHGDAGLKLVALERPLTTSNPPGGPTGEASGLRYLTVQVDDVGRAIERCQSAGGTVVMAPFDYEGSPVAIVEDPEGNWVELIQ